MSCDFITQTHGKWILTGEHAVVRGGKALVFPIKDKTLTLRYKNNTNKLTAEFHGHSGDDTHLLFWSVIEHGLEVLGYSLNDFSGHFILENHIPIGAGMGASAALCVAVSRFFHHLELIPEEKVYAHAQQLENLFHAKSSGLDIAGTSHEQGICFHQGHVIPIQQSWQPHWYLSFSGQIGATSHCVKQVQAGFDASPTTAKNIDKQMEDSVEMALKALNAQAPEQGLAQLKVAIQLGNDCFKQWGLAEGQVDSHLNQLLEAGAMAAKPTGSGNGGYILSLWDSPPPAQIVKDFIPLETI